MLSSDGLPWALQVTLGAKLLYQGWTPTCRSTSMATRSGRLPLRLRALRGVL